MLSSIGNDIIALQLINSERTKQEKFYSKIISQPEFSLFNNKFLNALSFEHFIWLAWSAKESVHKFYKRYNHNAAFSPTKIIIHQIELPTQQTIFCFDNSTHEAISFNKEECYCCKVTFNASTFYARSIISNEMIFTVVNDSNCFENIYWGIKAIDDDSYANQSETVRAFVLSKLNKLYLNKEFNIQKCEAGYPLIEEQKDLPLSFSHHGNFVAYAFAIA
jgi:phosphopantetheinyl transferase (holo-ACP synthase)